MERWVVVTDSATGEEIHDKRAIASAIRSARLGKISVIKNGKARVWVDAKKPGPVFAAGYRFEFQGPTGSVPVGSLYV